MLRLRLCRFAAWIMVVVVQAARLHHKTGVALPMHEHSLLDLVHSVICYGLSLRDRLEAGEALQLQAEQDKLQHLLAAFADDENDTAELQSALDLDIADLSPSPDSESMTPASIRYLLTCWLDELFAHYSPWAQRWSMRTLQAAMYRRNRRQSFWEEVRFAEMRSDIDVLQVAYWCVMLGFQGSWRDRPEWIEAWTSRIRVLLEEHLATADVAPLDWAHAVHESLPQTDLPFRRMLFLGMLTASLFAPVFLWLYWRHSAI